MSLHWPVLHVQVPDLHRQVVSGHHVASVVAKLDVRDRGYDLGEEGAIAGILWLLEHCSREKSMSQIQLNKCCKWNVCVRACSSQDVMIKKKILTFGVLVTKCWSPHVTQTNGSFAAAVDEGVTLMRMELGRRDHLCQLLHVGRFNVNNIWRARLRRTNPWKD